MLHKKQAYPPQPFLMGIAPTFWMYGVVCIIGALWGYRYIPETKGRSLEDIEQHWRKGGTPKDL